MVGNRQSVHVHTAGHLVQTKHSRVKPHHEEVGELVKVHAGDVGVWVPQEFTLLQHPLAGTAGLHQRQLFFIR